MEKKTAQQVLARNLAMLIAHTGFPSTRSFAPKTGVSDRTMGNIMNQTASPSLDTIEKIADYFGVPSYVLLIDGVRPQDILSHEVEALVGDYLALPEGSRESVLRVAEMEGRYTVLQQLPEKMPDPSAGAAPRPATVKPAKKAR